MGNLNENHMSIRGKQPRDGLKPVSPFQDPVKRMKDAQCYGALLEKQPLCTRVMLNECETWFKRVTCFANNSTMCCRESNEIFCRSSYTFKLSFLWVKECP